MKKFSVALLFLAAAAASAQTGAYRKLPLPVLRDKIQGGWAGQMIGVSYGAPTEFKSLAKILEAPLDPWTPEPRLQFPQPGRSLRGHDVRQGPGR